MSKKVRLADFTSLGVGGAADAFVVNSLEELQQALSKQKTGIKPWVLSYGTNCLISDKGLEGPVIVIHGGNIDIQGTIITAEAGAWWDDVVIKSLKNDLWGLELMSGIPGGVGAAVVGNIAAYGQKIADTFVSAEVYDTHTKSVRIIQAEELAFAYRTSALQHNDPRKLIILRVTFQLSFQPTTELAYQSALDVATDMNISPDGLDNRRELIMETRHRAGSLLDKHYKGSGKTAGSFFKNPLVNAEQLDHIASFEEQGKSLSSIMYQNKIHGGEQTRISAAHVLLAAGFKRGQSWGAVRLHPEHILKVENTGDAKAQDIYDVAQNIISTVKQKLSIELEPEVRFIGDFE